ncbi:hypothetical protein KY290_021095 [Solanum tuberosum]|uniref:Uncharacterized protein n=1 Tax=Solanum tuberosum TaxID=4113 RepID=A0ABQ7V0K0_SOLTU|nr:hypothetical protein KY289_020271 [Solanum tuberosum]KAH0757602.1 hypothetical protein KY290_021095 [Solanum tuberosum]
MEARLRFVKSDDKEIKCLQLLSSTMICKMKLRTAHQKAFQDFENIVIARGNFKPQDMLIENIKTDNNDDDYENEEEEEKKPSSHLDCMMVELLITRMESKT